MGAMKGPVRAPGAAKGIAALNSHVTVKANHKSATLKDTGPGATALTDNCIKAEVGNSHREFRVSSYRWLNINYVQYNNSVCSLHPLCSVEH